MNRTCGDQQRKAFRLSIRVFLLVKVALLALFVHNVFLSLAETSFGQSEDASAHQSTLESQEAHSPENITSSWILHQHYGGFCISEILASMLLVGYALRHWPAMLDSHPPPKAAVRKDCTGAQGDTSEPARTPSPMAAKPIVTTRTGEGDTVTKACQRSCTSEQAVWTDHTGPGDLLLLPDDRLMDKVRRLSIARSVFVRGHVSKYLRRYNIKAKAVRHLTQSKQRMLGSLCVRRNVLRSDVVTMMELVQASRSRLDSQRDANRTLLRYIEQAAGASGDDLAAGYVTGSSSNNNNSLVSASSSIEDITNNNCSNSGSVDVGLRCCGNDNCSDSGCSSNSGKICDEYIACSNEGSVDWSSNSNDNSSSKLCNELMTCSREGSVTYSSCHCKGIVTNFSTRSLGNCDDNNNNNSNNNNKVREGSLCSFDSGPSIGCNHRSSAGHGGEIVKDTGPAAYHSNSNYNCYNSKEMNTYSGRHGAIDKNHNIGFTVRSRTANKPLSDMVQQSSSRGSNNNSKSKHRCCNKGNTLVVRVRNLNKKGSFPCYANGGQLAWTACVCNGCGTTLYGSAVARGSLSSNDVTDVSLQRHCFLPSSGFLPRSAVVGVCPVRLSGRFKTTACAVCLRTKQRL